MIEQILRTVLPAAYELVPEEYNSVPATAFLLAVGLQSSRFLLRKRLRGWHGLWTLCGAHVEEALRQRHTRPVLIGAAHQLGYSILMLERAELAAALTHNDVLAAVAARCLLETSRATLPDPRDAPGAWELYQRVWMPEPDKAAAATWPGLYAEAWDRARMPVPAAMSWRERYAGELATRIEQAKLRPIVARATPL